jgi:hypothetical protein
MPIALPSTMIRAREVRRVRAAQRVEDVQIVIHEIANVVGFGEVIRFAEPRVAGGDNVKEFGEALVEFRPRSRAALGVQEEDRFSRAGHPGTSRPFS